MTIAEPAPQRGWQACSLPEHLRELRRQHDILAWHLGADRADERQREPLSPSPRVQLAIEELGAVLIQVFEHLDGLHADDVLVRLRPAGGQVDEAAEAWEDGAWDAAHLRAGE